MLRRVFLCFELRHNGFLELITPKCVHPGDGNLLRARRFLSPAENKGTAIPVPLFKKHVHIYTRASKGFIRARAINFLWA
jgi:hypothetical protein